MRLIADSGSTKTDWSLVDGAKIVFRINTQGMNPYVHTDDSLNLVIKEELLTAEVDVNTISSIEFYGAGCSDVFQINRIRKILKKNFLVDNISVDHDLLGAAKASCRDQEGIAIILGTGSNSCYFNGTSILKNVRSLGYILGDEGSGCYMGKRLVQDYLNDDLPLALKFKFESDFNLSPSQIFEKVYKQAFPNRYLASFAIWISKNDDNLYLRTIIKESFEDFFKQHIVKYENYKKLLINVVGSVGFHNSKILQEVANAYGCKLGTIIKSPMEGLI